MWIRKTCELVSATIAAIFMVVVAYLSFVVIVVVVAALKFTHAACETLWRVYGSILKQKYEKEK